MGGNLDHATYYKYNGQDVGPIFGRVGVRITRVGGTRVIGYVHHYIVLVGFGTISCHNSGLVRLRGDVFVGLFGTFVYGLVLVKVGVVGVTRTRTDHVSSFSMIVKGLLRSFKTSSSVYVVVQEDGPGTGGVYAMFLGSVLQDGTISGKFERFFTFTIGDPTINSSLLGQDARPLDGENRGQKLRPASMLVHTLGVGVNKSTRVDPFYGRNLV